MKELCGHEHPHIKFHDRATSIGDRASEHPAAARFRCLGSGEPGDRGANASGKTPVVFIHGLWLLPSSWDAWTDFFKQAGYATLTPNWRDDPETVEAARANPEVLAKKTLKQVADHTTEVVNALDEKPAIMGHSTPRHESGPPAGA